MRGKHMSINGILRAGTTGVVLIVTVAACIHWLVAARAGAAERAREQTYAKRTEDLLHRIVPDRTTQALVVDHGATPRSEYYTVTSLDRSGADIGSAVWEPASDRLVMLSANQRLAAGARCRPLAAREAADVAVTWARELALLGQGEGLLGVDPPTQADGFWTVRVRARGRAICLRLYDRTGALTCATRWSEIRHGAVGR